MNFVNSLLIDHFGRIRIMTIGLVGCILVMSCYTAMVASFAGTPNKVGNAFGVFFMFLLAIPYAGCLDASSYVYCSEIFPTAIRAYGVGFSVSGLFLSNLGESLLANPCGNVDSTDTLPTVYTQAAPTAFANIGWRYFMVFIIVPTLGLFFLVKLYPETKNLSLEEVRWFPQFLPHL